MNDDIKYLKKGMMIEALCSWTSGDRFLKGERAVIVEIESEYYDGSGTYRVTHILNPRGKIYKIHIRQNLVKIIRRTACG